MGQEVGDSMLKASGAVGKQMTTDSLLPQLRGLAPIGVRVRRVLPNSHHPQGRSTGVCPSDKVISRFLTFGVVGRDWNLAVTLAGNSAVVLGSTGALATSAKVLALGGLYVR